VCKIVADTIGKDAMATPECCVMMDFMSAETEARLTRASRTYARLRPQWRDAVRELHEAIIAERQEGAKIEDITARVPVRQTQVNRILKAAGLVEERKGPAEP